MSARKTKHQKEILDQCSELDKKEWIQAMLGVMDDGKLLSGQRRMMDFAEIRATGGRISGPLSKEETQASIDHMNDMATAISGVVVAGNRRS